MSVPLILRRTLLTSFSTILNGILGALFFFLLAKWLGDSSYGIFSLIVLAITLVAGVADFGTDQGIIKFVSANRTSDNFYPYAKLALLTKICSSILTAIVLAIFSSIAFSVFFPHLSDPSLLILVGLGVMSQLLFSFSTSLALSREKFGLWSALFIGTNIFRLMLLLVLFFSGNLSVYSAAILYIVIPLLGFLIFLNQLKTRFLTQVITRVVIKNFFSFNIWLVLVTVLSTIASRLDILYTARMLPLSAVGIYTLVSQIVIVFPQLTSALGAVTAPRFASLAGYAANSKLTRETIIFSTLMALLTSFLLLGLGVVVLNFSGPAFLSGITPLVILIGSNALFYLLTPIRDSLMFYHTKPFLFVIVSLIQIITIMILSPILIPNFGLIGTSILVLVHTILASLIYLFSYLQLSKRRG